MGSIRRQQYEERAALFLTMLRDKCHAGKPFRITGVASKCGISAAAATVVKKNRYVTKMVNYGAVGSTYRWTSGDMTIDRLVPLLIVDIAKYTEEYKARANAEGVKPVPVLNPVKPAKRGVLSAVRGIFSRLVLR